jgi:hypothetical protein
LDDENVEDVEGAENRTRGMSICLF